MKNIRIFYLKIFHFLVVKFSVHLNRHVFVMEYLDNGRLTSKYVVHVVTYETAHYKTNKMACEPSAYSDQPGHPSSLISICSPHEENLGPYLPTEHTVIRLGGRSGWSESSLGAHASLMVLSFAGSYVFILSHRRPYLPWMFGHMKSLSYLLKFEQVFLLHIYVFKMNCVSVKQYRTVWSGSTLFVQAFLFYYMRVNTVYTMHCPMFAHASNSTGRDFRAKAMAVCQQTYSLITNQHRKK